MSKKPARAQREYFEEYRKCGCVSEKTRLRKNLPGYCIRHGSDVENIYRCGNSLQILVWSRRGWK